MQNLIKNLPESIKVAIKASAPLVIVIILSIILTNFGIPKVNDLRNQIAEAQTLKATLSQKLSILQSFSQTSVATNIDSAVNALPSTNPAAVIISQLKNVSSCCGVLVAGIKTGPGTGNSSLLTTNTNFQVVGPREGVISYLKNVETIAPITTVDRVRISENGGVATANVSVVSYWAPNPKVIPPVREPITDLTASEKKVLSEVASLIQPGVVQGAPSVTGVNPAPFGQ